MTFTQIPKWIWILGVLSAAGAGAYFLTKRSDSENEDEFGSLVRDMIVNGVSSNSGISSIKVKKCVNDLANLKGMDSLPEIMRIDMKITKISPDEVDLEIPILLKGASSPKTVNVKKTLAWHELPKQYREKLIRTEGKDQFYLIYNKEA